MNAYFTSDGNYAIDFNSTDSAGNIGDANRYYVLIDSTAPVISAGIPSGTVTTQAVTLGVTTNELATCKYSLTDEAYSAMASTVTSSATTHTWNFTWGANDNGNKTYYVRCADSNAGTVNSTSTTITFTLNIASGGGGTVVSSASGEKANWTNAIRAGYSQKITYTNQDNLVDSIQLFAKNSITRTKLVFDKEVDSIDGVDDSDNLYKYFEITFEGNNEDLEKAEISFRVSNAWILENNYKNQSFVLYRLVDDKWVKLDTSYLEQDLEYSYYTATTPGFSYFAILAGEKAPVPDTPADDSGSDDSSDNGDDSDGDDSSDDGDSQDNGDASDNGDDVTPPVDDVTLPVDDDGVVPPVDDQAPAQDFTGIIILLVIIILVAVGAYYYTQTKGKNKLAFK